MNKVEGNDNDGKKEKGKNESPKKKSKCHKKQMNPIGSFLSN